MAWRRVHFQQIFNYFFNEFTLLLLQFNNSNTPQEATHYSGFTAQIALSHGKTAVTLHLLQLIVY